LLPDGDAIAVHERPIGGLKILHPVLIPLSRQQAMVAGNGGLIANKIAIGCTAEYP
jgi:hypothetical protein